MFIDVEIGSRAAGYECTEYLLVHKEGHSLITLDPGTPRERRIEVPHSGARVRILTAPGNLVASFHYEKDYSDEYPDLSEVREREFDLKRDFALDPSPDVSSQ